MEDAVTLANVTLQLDDGGQGAPILLVHGHPFDRSLWGPQQSALASRYRVLAPDLRGYGQSSVVPGKTTLEVFARDLHELLAARGLGGVPVILVGLSMGGQIVLEFARLFPGQVRALVLAATFARADDEAGRNRRLQTAARLQREGMAGYAEELVPQMVAAATLQGQPAVVAQVRRMMQGTPAEGAAAALRGRAERLDYRVWLGSVAVPTLVVVGREDAFTPVADAEELHRLIPDCELVVIERAGHLPNLEQPEEFNRVVGAFLRRRLEGAAG